MTNETRQKKSNQNDTIFLYPQHKTDNEYSYIYKSYYTNEVNTIDVSKKWSNTTVFDVCFCKKKASLFLHFSFCLQSVIGY